MSPRAIICLRMTRCPISTYSSIQAAVEASLSLDRAFTAAHKRSSLVDLLVSTVSRAGQPDPFKRPTQVNPKVYNVVVRNETYEVIATYDETAVDPVRAAEDVRWLEEASHAVV